MPDFPIQRRLLTIDELCRKLSVDRTWFSRSDNKRKLKAQGFPDPVPGLGRRWDPRAVDRWLDQIGGLTAPATPESSVTTLSISITPETDELAEQQKILRQRLANMGAPRH